ncbi:MAG: VWA domain-containing protein [Acidobacteria bacterium]|jgi:Ca-activated chloride channel family protein|nr:VWA domain-containing protein [Acidobacteriota bacterium]
MEKRSKNKAILLFTVLALALAAATALNADGFIVIPRPPRPGPTAHFPLEVTRHDVRVAIDGQLATTVVDQEFYNPNDSRLEGYYLFPLPPGAAIKDFSMWIDGRETRAELLDSAKARGIYEDIVRRLRDPALLEYDGRGVFKMRVFPIEPRSRKRIKISYHEVLEKSNGAISYFYPLGTEKFSARAIPEVSIVLDIHSPSPLAGIHCPTHPVEVSRPGQGRATVRYSGRDVLPDSDFRLFFTPATGRLGFSLLAFRPAGQDGTFFFSASPSFANSSADVAAKDITFVVDTSGSMAGRAMEQARSAMAYCLGRLNRADRFNVVRFSTEAESLFQGLAPASEANRRRAKEFVAAWQAAGGTHCEEALQIALGEAGSPDEGAGRLRVVVLITDGRPTIGETDDEALLRLVRRSGSAKLRLFPVAIGSEINTHLLDGFAEQTRTFRTYIPMGEEIESGISRFYDKISSPVLSDVRLDIAGSARTSHIHPRQLPDLYKGSTLTVVGRYQGAGAMTFTLRGKVNGRSEEFAFRADLPQQSLDHDFLPPLWAARRVGYLLDQIRLHGESRELIDEVTRLARQYGIVTPYTSYLIVEDEKGRLQRGDLAAGDMTVGGVASAPALEREQREEFAAMKDKSGSGSVRASTELQKLNQAEAVADTRSGNAQRQLAQQTRVVQGQAFYFNNGSWVDARIQGRSRQRVQRIAFASAEYFSLLKKQPELAPVLAQGRNVRFVQGDQVVEIYDAAAGE